MTDFFLFIRGFAKVRAILDTKYGLRTLLDESSSYEDAVEKIRSTATRQLAMGEDTLVVTFPIYSSSKVSRYNKQELLIFLEYSIKEGYVPSQPRIAGPHQVGTINVRRGFDKVLSHDEHVELRVPSLERIPYHKFAAIMDNMWDMVKRGG
jgi:hypothetical protein